MYSGLLEWVWLVVFLSACVDVRLVFVCECRQKGDVDNKVSEENGEQEREKSRSAV